MNTRARLSIILIVITLSMILVWPNIGQRQVQVFFLSDLKEKQIEESMSLVEEFLEKNYKGEHTWERKKTEVKKAAADEAGSDIKFVAEEKSGKPYIEISGNFIQAAFLNELSRIKGVDGEQTNVVPLWMEKKLKAKAFKLGLDLQGGMNLVLEGEFDKLLEQYKRRYSEEYIKELKDKIVKEKDETKKQNFEFELEQITDATNLTEGKKREYMQGALEIIRSRIDKTGVSEPQIRIQGFDKIEVSLPGVASPTRAKKMIASTAKVEYHIGESTDSRNNPGEFTNRANQKFAEFAELTPNARYAFIQKLEKELKMPSKFGIYTYWDKVKNDPKQKLRPVRFMVLHNKIAMSGDDISPNTYVGFDPERIQQTVNFTLTPEGRDKFCQLTKENKNRALAIVIDDQIRSSPNINEPICGGQVQISGSFTQQEAKDLALIIKEGALPVPMAIAEERSIGPSLGQDAIEKGTTAIGLGLLAVAIFMLIYYHMGGIIANLALLMNLLLMSAMLAWMDFTVTLPGLAGVVLTLGMAVDANVIIYERIREELGRGKSLKLASSQGFERATLTILDANFTTMVAAIVLSKFGVGPIKGFAVTLFIGILTSLFTALFMSKTLFFVLVYDFNVKSLSLGWGKHRNAVKNLDKHGLGEEEAETAGVQQ